MKCRFLFFIALAITVFSGCKDHVEFPRSLEGIVVNYPEGVSDLRIKTDTLIFKNISNGLEIKICASETSLDIPKGFYDCSYKAEVTYDNGGSITDGILKGYKDGVEIVGSEISFTIDAFLFVDKQDFIIEEIFFAGTLRATGKQYYGDGYVKLYNNTDKVLYADGIALVESAFTSVSKYDYSPDIRNEAMSVAAIYVIPGNGTEYPVAPGESILICDTGIDHRLANENSFDLSRADFEWFDVSNSPSNLDIDSEAVTNLDKYYCYTFSFWVMHNRGFRSYAIARIPVDKETYLKDYYYTYNYTMVLEAGTFPMEGDAYKIPNSWIVDAVNCSVESERVWNILPPSLDAGWTYCGRIDGDPTRYFKSVRRKMLYLTDDGIRVLKDTNNSSEDFNAESIPSLIEEQSTAINAEGTRAVIKTYDGVQPIR